MCVQMCRTMIAQLNARVSELVASEIAARGELNEAKRAAASMQQEHSHELSTLEHAQRALRDTLCVLQSPSADAAVLDPAAPQQVAAATDRPAGGAGSGAHSSHTCSPDPVASAACFINVTSAWRSYTRCTRRPCVCLVK